MGGCVMVSMWRSEDMVQDLVLFVWGLRIELRKPGLAEGTLTWLQGDSFQINTGFLPYVE